MVSCGLACPGGGGAGVSGCEFRGSGWGWDRRCQDPGARGLGPGGGALGGPYHMGGGGGGGSNTEHGTIYTDCKLANTFDLYPHLRRSTPA